MLLSQIVISLVIYSVSCYKIRLTCDQIRTFVDGHNQRRFRIANGTVPGQPAAADMKYMVWDEELADKAENWAETLNRRNLLLVHNPDHTIRSQRWGRVGENINWAKVWPTTKENSVPNITHALNDWFEEHKDYGFQPFQLGTPKQIGHYTQMVWADTNRVGCGISQKTEDIVTTTIIICNYGPPGNYFGQRPYPKAGHRGKGYLKRGDDCKRPYGSYC